MHFARCLRLWAPRPSPATLVGVFVAVVFVVADPWGGLSREKPREDAVLFVVNITMLSFSPGPKTAFSKRFWRGNAQPEICSFLYQKRIKNAIWDLGWARAQEVPGGD